MNANAAVVDLETFRRRRARRERAPRPVPALAPAPGAVLLVPCWVGWVPVWPIA